MNSLGIVFGAWGKGVICNGQSLNEGSTINASPSGDEPRWVDLLAKMLLIHLMMVRKDYLLSFLAPPVSASRPYLTTTR